MAKKKSGWKQCSIKGCRRRRKTELYCGPCQSDVDAQVEPSEVVKQLTEIERLRFFECDIAMRNHAQEIRILDQEQKLDSVDFESRKRTRQGRVNELKAAIQLRTVEQRQILADLAEKYAFDANNTSFDDKTGAIHEQPPNE